MCRQTRRERCCENGGATGTLDLGTLVLVPTVVKGVRVPVIGGGGVADGHGVAAVLALGAEFSG